MAEQELIAVLEEARALLARPDNDYAWSSWENAEAALKEIGAHIEALRQGRAPDVITLSVLFAATGPMQEVSLSSGWGDRFLALADRFDRAIAGVRHT